MSEERVPAPAPGDSAAAHGPPRPGRASSRPRRPWLWTALALLPLAVLTAPNVGFLLPGYESHLGENYQPLRALKFYASRGGEVHKYGNLPNLLLLPVYGPALGVWWATGDFGPPSGDFPYGFARPLEQLSFLIRAGRIEFMLLGLALYAFFLIGLRRLDAGGPALLAAFLACIGTNHAAAHFLANTRPDGPTFAFVAASLAVYVRILTDGATVAPGAWLSVFAVCAISSKELAGPLYVLPYLGLAVYLWRRAGDDPARRAAVWRVGGVSAATGVVAYLLLNVVYNPAAWWLRMGHWLGGAGTSQDVWRQGGAAGLTAGVRAVEAFEGFLNTLGPGGLPLALVALVALAVWRPPFAGMLLLPFASITLLGLVPLGFPGDRFYTVATVALVPPVALGLGALLARAGRLRPTLLALGAAALAVNLWFGAWAWLQLEHLPERVLERALAEETPPFTGRLNVLNVHPRVPGKSRLEVAGHDLDPRSIQQLRDASPASRPERIYAHRGTLRFLEDAAGAPERAAFLEAQGLESGRWEGVEALGYRLRETVRTPTPAWFPFGWMPAVRWTTERSPVLVYEKELPR